MCYVLVLVLVQESRIPYLGKGAKNWAKKRGVKKQKMPDLTRGGDSNDISHCSLIQVNTAVSTWLYKYGTVVNNWGSVFVIHYLGTAVLHAKVDVHESV